MKASHGRLQVGRLLIRYGVLLFFLGLVAGLAASKLANPRMGLASHPEGVMNGIFLALLGLIWPRLRLGDATSAIAFWLVLGGAYVNWATTLAAAAWGAGSPMMPIAGLGQRGTQLQETVIGAGLVSLSVAMIVGCLLVLWGLRGTEPDSEEPTGADAGTGRG